MKTLVTHWILALSMLVTFALAATSRPAEEQVAVLVDSDRPHHYQHYHPRYEELYDRYDQ
jgi:hypothetical protein